MRFRTLTGAQRHRVTNMLFFAGVVSAIGTVTGTSLLGCPAVSRESKLDGEQHNQKIDGSAGESIVPEVARPRGLKQKQFVGGKIESVATDE
ncbi:hypothetical protein J3B02_000853 [Coemansia erecta]|uniref:Uncharacterized protein n=1 Tax=Coemansia asiatica TaxID=1052880 RepID=A0A9W7XLC7_9FUNG|nr:hypothetical protein LPJ64_003165 [Coemansia asiatica]KAJ2857656.1 hypothetical protein J3B02_000853 [Coemansia erecta]